MRVRSTPRRSIALLASLGLLAITAMSPAVAAAEPQKASGPPPKFTSAVAFDISPALPRPCAARRPGGGRQRPR